MLLIAAAIFTVWVLLSVVVLALCVVAGRADRAIEYMMLSPSSETVPALEADVPFVVDFAEPQAAPVLPSMPARTTR
jgi:hypothetical protein